MTAKHKDRKAKKAKHSRKVSRDLLYTLLDASDEALAAAQEEFERQGEDDTVRFLAKYRLLSIHQRHLCCTYLENK